LLHAVGGADGGVEGGMGIGALEGGAREFHELVRSGPLPPQLAVLAGVDRTCGGDDFGLMSSNLRPTCCGEDENGQPPANQILLRPQVLVRRDQQVKPCLGRSKKVSIGQAGPAQLECRRYRVTGERVPHRGWGALVENDSHAGLDPERIQATAKLRSACSSTASTCSRLTPGNQARKSFSVAPSSRFSKSARTGTRVFLNTQAPLTLPGTRSTAVHCVQSSIV